ncbi:MAG: penicillin-binding protein 2 [Streptosporangiales bacterium]|nr:penicillin-binding protein 2 [Streptosporangiales bacterium]
MNKPLRRIAVACLVLFGLLFVNANYIQGVKAEELRNRPGNARILIQQYERHRGPILVDRRPVASSKETRDQLKYLRVYRNGGLYAPATGYYSLYGATGIERAENEVLNGTDARLFVRRVVDLITGKQPKGGAVELTLNDDAQRAAYEGLRESGKAGAVVALDPRTGAILAMASVPSYNPNPLASHNSKEIQRYYDRLEADPSKPMLNRALQNTYPPGSTFKVVTAAAALSSGGYKPSSQIPAPDSLPLPQSTHAIQNFGGSSCGGQTTLAQALQISCNTAFADLGMEVGEDALRAQAEKFGLDSQVEVPMQSAQSVFPSGMDQAQTALSAIGQYDVRITPLQAAMVAAGVANDGVVMKPYLVNEVKAPDLSTVERGQPEDYERAVSPEVAGQLTEMMKSVVAAGTGTSAQIPGVEVAGKTGTAQHAPGEPPHAWFTGFAPAGDPEVAVAVVVESGGNMGSEATGGQVAAPIAKAVMEAVMAT